MKKKRPLWENILFYGTILSIFVVALMYIMLASVTIVAEPEATKLIITSSIVLAAGISAIPFFAVRYIGRRVVKRYPKNKPKKTNCLPFLRKANKCWGKALYFIIKQKGNAFALFTGGT